jgi:HPt (histidine-containing phosphotransfer) domain-containing protein
MAALDPTILDELAAQIGPDDLRAVVAAFRADLAALGARFSELPEGEERRRAAHALAGAAANCGAVPLAEAARAAMQGTAEPARIAALLGETLAALDARLG